MLIYAIKSPNQVVPLVLLSRFEVRHNGKSMGSERKTQPSRVFQDARWHLLSKGQSGRNLKATALERGPT